MGIMRGQLPCITCPRIERTVQSNDCYREIEADDKGVTIPEMDNAPASFKAELMRILGEQSIIWFEHRVEEVGCNGPDVVIVDEQSIALCPVQNILNKQYEI